MHHNKTIPLHTHIPQLDGLRGLAILLVICYHYFPHIVIFNIGWSGVDLFFVLSGFLISSRILPYLGDKKLLLKFYRNRVLRIIPLYYAFLVLFFLGWFFLTSKETLASGSFFAVHWWQFFLFTQNWVFIQNIAEVKVNLMHLWSVAIEEQFYLIFPLLVILVKNREKLFIGALTILITIIALRCLYFRYGLLEQTPDKIYWNSFFRLDSFIIGFLLYLFLSAKELKRGMQRLYTILFWIAFGSTITGIFIFKNARLDNPYFAYIGLTALAIIYSYLLYFCIYNKDSFFGRFTVSRFLTFTGKISYGIYIFHWPLFFAGFAMINKLKAKLGFTLGETGTEYLNAFLCIALTYLISYLSYKYYESFFLKHKVKYTQKA